MSRFIQWLEGLNEKDTKVRAVLRRSLAFDPGQYVPAYPYVEPFVSDEGNSWWRQMHYMVAGLWAAHWQEGLVGKPLRIGQACQDLFIAKDKSPSIERRFITLLDSDQDQLPHRMRQMLGLLKEYPIDFDALLTGLLYWNDDRKRTQNTWARDFYRNIQDDTEPEPTIQEEQTV
ncbi:MAG: type I-E CRISPR-associated protein Cse2/CasB [Nitrospirales bacterium]|nr:type I-E CRISPR-associated protein Cse2/CasB [Nitrospirales bacterium]